MDIKIVTAFFDIGRGNYKELSRDTDKYFQYFKFWARIQNELIIYCQSFNAEKIINIRKEFGLEEKTKIVIVDDFKSIEHSIYVRMKEIEKNIKFKDFRYCDNALSNGADYDYVMLLKWWCLQDAAKREEPEKMMAWLDFGYNHGGELYINPNDFSFKWEYDFEPKINCFCIIDPREACAIDSLQFQYECFIGHTAVMPAKLCNFFWNEMRDAMISLMSLDCIDDDQQLELMVYKRHPELFKIRICNWFEDMLICSNQQLTTRNKVEKIPVRQKIKKVLNKIIRKHSFMTRISDKYRRYVA